MAEPHAPRRRGQALVALTLVMGVIVAIAVLAVQAFNWGLAEGLGAGAVTLVIYTVPATVFDWPRLTFEDIINALGALVSAIGSFIAWFFGW